VAVSFSELIEVAALSFPVTNACEVIAVGMIHVGCSGLCYLLVQSSAVSSSTLGAFQFPFEVSVCASQLMVRTLLLCCVTTRRGNL